MENCTKERQETLEKIARQVLTAAPVFKKKLFRPDIEQKDNPIPLSYVQVLAALDEAMAANACDAGRLNELFTQKQETEARLEQEMARWEELSLALEES